jgi:hypothetical protein
MNKGLRRNGAYSDQIHSHDVDDLPKDEIARTEVGIISVDEKTSINKFDDVSQHDVGIVCATRRGPPQSLEEKRGRRWALRPETANSKYVERSSTGTSR